jgi:predicted small secreted protein
MKMTKTRIALLTVLLVIFSLSAGNVMAQGAGKGKQKNSPPFLITGKMPHLTKLLMQQWDNSELHLSDEQKSKLLVVRKETIGDAQKLGQEITPLEKQVAEGSLAGKTPDELQSLVQAIAGLKAEATMVHLRCIYNTSNILDQQQLDFLNNL